MLFCSREFLWFFAAVFTLYWLMPWQRARVWLLLVASFCFYATWNHWLALLIGVSTFVDYVLARGIDSWQSPRGRLSLLILSVTANLGLLCTFKYCNFFLDSLETALRAANVSASMPVLQVMVPVGISFYTFEAINYIVDVYKRKAPAERDLANFMLFITFFPHLVAGPIVRARDFLPQIHRPKHWSWPRLQLGVELFLLGLFKKLVIADRMAVFVDPVFADPGAFRSEALWTAMMAYPLQVYGDFSGYSDMALGAAHMLGYKLAPNFDMPYFAVNISDFWRRWHISLSTWLRDYLYYPLGGSRGSEWLTARNLLVTMTLCGLWHGASWNYVLFGVIHGALLIGHRHFRKLADVVPALGRGLANPLGTAFCIALTFFVFACTLVVFRTQTLGNALMYYDRLLFFDGGHDLPARDSVVFFAYLIVFAGHVLALQPWFMRARTWLPTPAVSFGYCVFLTLTLVLTPKSGQAFIYFQF